MIDADRLRNSYVADNGTIDQFGTVRIVRTTTGRRRTDDEVRVYSPILHEYADSDHQATLKGATMNILFQGRVVATLKPQQMEPTGPQLDGLVIEGGFIIDPRNERGSVEANALERASRGIDPQETLGPDSFRENPWARVSPRLRDRRVVAFWLDDDYAVVFDPVGNIIEATVEYPLAKATWEQKNKSREAGPS